MAKEKSVEFVVRIKDAGTATLKQIEQAAARTVEKLFSFKDVIGGIAGAVGAFSLANLIKDIVDLGIASDKTFRQIAANLPSSHEGLTQLKADLQALAVQSGRTRSEVQAAAVEISRLGVSNAGEVSARLKAATTFADATGMDLKATVQGLDQIMDAFNLNAGQAEEALAQLRAVAKQQGVDVESLFGAFQKATPHFQELGISVDVATRAIVNLLNAGHNVKQVGSELNSYNGENLLKIASSAKTVENALRDLRTEADENRKSVGSTIESLKSELGGTLDDLGTRTLPTIIAGLRGINTLLAEIANNKLGESLGIGGANDPMQAFKRSLGTPEERARTTWNTNHGSSGAWGGSGPAGAAKATGTLNGALTNDQIKALADAAKVVAELRAQMDAFGESADSTTPKTDALVKQFGELASKAAKSNMSLSDSEAFLEHGFQVIEKSRAAETLANQAKAAKDTADAWRKLDDAFGKLSGSKITEFDQQFADLFATLEEGKKKFTTVDDFLAYADAVDRLKAKYGELRKAVVEADGVQKLLNDDLDGLAALKPGLDALAKDLADQAKAEERVRQLAQAWDQVGRSVIAAAQAVGGLDDKTAASLQNMVTLGHGIFDLFSGNIGQGLAESVSSLAALGKGLFGGGGPSAAQQEQARVLDANTRALQDLAALVRSGAAATALGGLNAHTAEAARTGIHSLITGAGGGDFGVASGLNMSAFLQADQVDAIKAAAKAMGITLDGTRESFTAFVTGIDEITPELQAAFDAQQLQLQEDYHIRLLRAQGFTTEADAEALAAEQAKEMSDEIAGFATDATIAALAAAQLAEATHAAAKASLDAAMSQANDDLSIDHITDPSQIFAKRAQAAQKAGGSLGALLGNFDLNNLSADDIGQLDSSFQDLFHQLETSPETVDLAGLSIDDLKNALLDLDSSAQAAADAVKAFSDANSQLSDDFDVYGTTAPDQVTQRAAAYGIDLSQFDLGTPAGVAAAIGYLQSDYGSATDPVRKQQDKALIDNLRQIQFPDMGDLGAGAGSGASAGGATSAIGAGFQSLTSVEGSRLGDYMLREVNLLTRIDANLDRFVTGFFTQRTSFAPLAPLGVSSLSSGLAAAAGSGGPATINIGSVGPIQVRTNGDDPTVQGTALGAAFIREINRELGTVILRGKIGRGDITVTGGSR